MKVLGIDPGNRRLGYGVVESGAGPASATARVRHAHHPAPGIPCPARLRVIHDGVAALHRPAPPGRGGGGERVLRQERADRRGAEPCPRRDPAGRRAWPGSQIAEYSPALIKKTIVGRGAALKPQVGYMVAQLLRLEAPPTPADAADGVAVALTHLHDRVAAGGVLPPDHAARDDRHRHRRARRARTARRSWCRPMAAWATRSPCRSAWPSGCRRRGHGSASSPSWW